MQATPDNVFIGANVSYKKETYVVVKINQKSLYLAKDPNFLSRWRARKKGTKWKDFCQKNNAFSVKYNEVDISEEEAAKKKEVEEKKEQEKKKEKKILPQSLEKQLVEAYKKGAKGKGFRALLQGSSDTEKVAPVHINTEKKMILFHYFTNQQNIWAFYDMENDAYIPFKKKEHYKDKEVIWPEKAA